MTQENSTESSSVIIFLRIGNSGRIAECSPQGDEKAIVSTEYFPWIAIHMTIYLWQYIFGHIYLYIVEKWFTSMKCRE